LSESFQAVRSAVTSALAQFSCLSLVHCYSNDGYKAEVFLYFSEVQTVFSQFVVSLIHSSPLHRPLHRNLAKLTILPSLCPALGTRSVVPGPSSSSGRSYPTPSAAYSHGTTSSNLGDRPPGSWPPPELRSGPFEIWQ